MVGCSRCVAASRRVAPSSRGAGRWLCRDALPTTSYPCRQASPDTPFRVRHDKRVLDPVKDAPSTLSAPARTGLPRLGTGVLARGTACATPSGPLRLLSLSQLILLFDPRREHSSVPTTTGPRCRAQTLSRLARRAIRRRRTWP